MIGQHPIAFLGHAAVKGAQPGLKMSGSAVLLRGRKRCTERGISVAVYEHPVGLLVHEDTLQADQDGRCLCGVRRGTDHEIDCRRRDRELIEERLRKQRGVMLPGMHYHVIDALLAQRPVDRCQFHELWPRTNHTEYFHRHPFNFPAC